MTPQRRTAEKKAPVDYRQTEQMGCRAPTKGDEEEGVAEAEAGDGVSTNTVSTPDPEQIQHSLQQVQR